MYEQVHPEDPFGRVMQQHFSQLNCALRSLAQYPDCEAQQRRFLGRVSTCSSRACMKHDSSEEGWNTKCLVGYGLKPEANGAEAGGTAFSGSMTHHYRRCFQLACSLLSHTGLMGSSETFDVLN